MKDRFLFTSESVSAGHPDKVCDAVSDTMVDAIFNLDGDNRGNRAAIETMVTKNLTVLAGEVSIPEGQSIDYVELARQTIADIGYNSPELQFDQNCEIINRIHKQSPEIAVGVDQGGAGDQGMMFGYATNETPELMPLPITMSHRIVRGMDESRLNGKIPFLRPDGKSQVTIAYEGWKPVAIEKVVVAVPHHPDTSNDTVGQTVLEKIVMPLVKEYGLTFSANDKNYIVNGTGIWTIGGPVSDAGLTGRKIIVDTYGGMGRHGGGAFSGKDPSKVDRSAAYAGRYVAKNLVAAGVADRLEIQLAYVIGHADPVSIMVDTFGTGKLPESRIVEIVRQVFDLTPQGIINSLDLRKPRFRKTAAYGHFGRNEDGFTWEKTDKVDSIRSLL
ncbi:MAG TPA: methionine adenosyltransferase [Calditrichia bacterium]|nr:methionine adenosyltransferase [Calditrichota bacterium]HQV32138.1 methionine adenosyltransferase [Calditrichia bacterium]